MDNMAVGSQFKPNADKTWQVSERCRGVLEQGTKPKNMFKSGPAMNWRLMQGWTLPSPIRAPERDEATKIRRARPSLTSPDFS